MPLSSQETMHAASLVPVSPVSVRGRIEPSALLALVWLTMRQLVRGRRLWVVAGAFLLPAVFAGISRSVNSSMSLADLESAMIFTLMLHALLPLAALWYGSALIQDEWEEQTLTYLLLRPLPRWSIYGCKLLATWLVLSVAAAGFTLIAYVAIYAGPADIWHRPVVMRAWKTVCLFDFALLSYCSIFGVLGFITRRTLTVGVIYIFLLEDLIANVDFIARRLTVMYYVQVLAERWLDWTPEDWSINLNRSPSALTCTLVLLSISIVATVFAAFLFSIREFRMKTPEAA